MYQMHVQMHVKKAIMYNVQQVKNSKVRYAKHQRLNLVLGDAWSHEIEIHNSHGHKVSYLTYDLENIAV